MTSVLGAQELRRAALAALEALRAHQDEIDGANIYPVPDGDTGTNLVLTMTSVAEALAGAPEEPRAVARAIQTGSLMGARGNSGVILAQVLRGVCEAVEDAGADARAVAKGLARGADLAYESILHPVEGTMLTVARAAAEAAAPAGGDDPGAVFDAASRGAHEALERTPDLLPVLKEAGVVDAGGMGLCVVLDAFAASLGGRPLTLTLRGLRPIVRHREAGSSAFAYEVQFLLEADDEPIADVRRRLAGIGDSVAVVGGAGLWNVHVHTNEVGRAIEIGMAAGTPSDISVVAFADQMAAVPASRSLPVAVAPSAVAVVAVVAGEGIRDLFAELGAGVLVDGGRTMNVSVGDLLDAVERAAAPNVILLVNSEDALAAGRAAARRASKRVEVIEAGDLAQGFAAMVAFSDGRSLEDNVRDVREALGRTRTGRIAIALRDAATPAGAVRAGDAIGFAGPAVAAVGRDPVEVTLAVAGALGPGEVLTVLAGADAPTDEVARLERALADRFPELSVEVREGGQPVHRYLLALE